MRTVLHDGDACAVPDGPGVHRIDPDELLISHRFDIAFASFVRFAFAVVDASVAETQSSGQHYGPRSHA